MNAVSVIIPAYKPDQKLIGTLNELVKIGFTDILVVDDGSGEQFDPVFQQVRQFPQCTLLRHSVNRGKGAALKTAMAWFAENRPGQAGVVTADADGQHLAADIAAVSRTMLESGHVVLGVRDFSGPGIPWTSRAGNRITIAVFRLFFGMKISDTQTGLRAVPRRYLSEIAAAKGDRYEFETHMLFLMNQRKIPFDEVKIATVYIEENNSSHFRFVRDSVRIYALILKYLLSSAAASVIDELAFYLFKRFAFLAFLPIPLTFTSAVLARVISSLVNYLINARVVFDGRADRRSLAKYYILAVVQIAISTSLVFLVEHVLAISSPALSTLVKIVIDVVLFFFSFRVQHKWVFNDQTKNTEPRKEPIS
ncbi:MAG: glycosyltransferase [Oscillospiraceae bacterium]